MIPSTLQRYVLRDILRVALLAGVALTGIIFVGMGVSLVNKGSVSYTHLTLPTN